MIMWRTLSVRPFSHPSPRLSIKRRGKAASPRAHPAGLSALSNDRKT
jgi:hypothetical protein